MAAGDLPVLIVGDVHGDIERLFAALKPYPADEWQTVFLGDLVDYGAFGVGCLRYARDRANTEMVLGNHEIAMLWALRDASRVGFWMGIGGQKHDLDELRRDDALQVWLRGRPALLSLHDRTLVQHTGSDAYLNLGANVKEINERSRDLLQTEGEAALWDVLSSPNILETQSERLDRYLGLMDARRVVFGHKPHRFSKPASYHGGKAINFDGGFSRFHSRFQRRSPLGASVAPLPD